MFTTPSRLLSTVAALVAALALMSPLAVSHASSTPVLESARRSQAPSPATGH